MENESTAWRGYWLIIKSFSGKESNNCAFECGIMAMRGGQGEGYNNITLETSGELLIFGEIAQLKRFLIICPPTPRLDWKLSHLFMVRRSCHSLYGGRVLVWLSVSNMRVVALFARFNLLDGGRVGICYCWAFKEEQKKQEL